MDLKEHEQWNETMAKRHDPDAFITKTGFLIRFVESIRLSQTKDLLDCRPTDVVLDLGCGPGNLLERLEGSRVVGYDLSDTLLAQARRRTAGRPQVELVKGFAESVSFPNNTFDRVVCSEVLEHVADPDAVLREIKRIAKPGARVVLTVPNEALINFCKKIMNSLRLRKWIAGEYQMSDNMLDEWHRTEIDPTWVHQQSTDEFVCVRSVCSPSRLFPLHRIFVFEVKK